MNQTDDLKLLRLQEDKKYINIDFIEGLARQLIDEVVQWANGEIFTPRGGELAFDITLGPPNAGVAISPNRPFHPRMAFSVVPISQADYLSWLTIPERPKIIDMETISETRSKAMPAA